MSKQKSLFDSNEFKPTHNSQKEKKPSKTKKQVQKEKQDFLDELNNVNSDKTNAVSNWQDVVLEKIKDEPYTLEDNLDFKKELAELDKELDKDIEDGILLKDDFIIEDGVLIIKNHQEQVNFNIKNLAKTIIDTNWNQNINPNNIELLYEVDSNGFYNYSSIVCTSIYGVRFKVTLSDVLDKLNKIPF
jgi:hypothetical protein